MIRGKCSLKIKKGSNKVKEYKHLCDCDKEKIKSRRELTIFLYKIFKIFCVILFTIISFFVGTIVFYTSLDNSKNISYAEPDNRFSKENNLKYEDYGGDKELEKSLEKIQANDEFLGIFGNGNNTNFYKENEDNSHNKEEHHEGANDFSQWNEKCPPELVVVNSKNRINKSYNVDIKVCRGKEIEMLAAASLEKMIQDASKDGIVLWISSGYRSIKYQEKLFNNQVKREKDKGNSQEKAEFFASIVVAKPGESEHNTGLAVDFNGVRGDFYTTKEYKWLMDNAVKYGFIERYQEKWRDKTGVIYEPWHFRYVGSYARDIKESNLCLEDYIERNLM